MSSLELHGNTQMIGSGIKGLIHYLFTYGLRGPCALRACLYMWVHVAHSSLTQCSMLPAHPGKESSPEKQAKTVNIRAVTDCSHLEV